jgi:hypothetical protein
VACIGVAAAKPAKSSPESVTIPLILQQAPQPKKPEPKKDEPKSPQAIIEEATPIAMQTQPSLMVPDLPPPESPTLAPALPTAPELFIPDLKPSPSPPPPKLATPPATEAKAASEPKPAPDASLVTIAKTALNNDATPPAPQPKAKPPQLNPGEMEPVEDVPNTSTRRKPPQPIKLVSEPQPALAEEPKRLIPQPKAKPVNPDPAEMKPVQDFSPGTFREGQDGKPPSFRCFVRDVMAFYDRTHVRCYNKVQGKVSYFAVDTNQPVAATVLAKALTAMQTGKPITISFAPGADLNPSNCGPKDCRRLIDIEN